jgi:hypothetical protein
VRRPALSGQLDEGELMTNNESLSAKQVVLRTAGAFALAVFALVPHGGLAEPAPNKGGPPPQDLSVTTEIQDLDADGNVCTISSDGQGVYQNGVNGVGSILTANTCNGLTWGDWRFGANGPRSVMESFFSTDAIQPGDPHYQAPANPPYVGSEQQVSVTMNVQCTCHANADMYTMTAGQSFVCPLVNWWNAPSGTWNYNVAGGFPETTKALVLCNSASGGHCVDWYIEPIDVQRPGGTDNEGVARLVGPASCKKCPPVDPDRGDYYMRFRIHVTLP